MKRVIAAFLFIVVNLPQLAFGWGREGHQIVAAVAEDHLDETTKVMIQSLIGNNHLYSIASWADDIRNQRPETGRLALCEYPPRQRIRRRSGLCPAEKLYRRPR